MKQCHKKKALYSCAHQNWTVLSVLASTPDYCFCIKAGVLESVRGRERDASPRQRPRGAPGADLCCLVLSWVSRAALGTAVTDQNCRAPLIEAFSVFIVSLRFIQRSPAVYSEVSEKGVSGLSQSFLERLLWGGRFLLSTQCSALPVTKWVYGIRSMGFLCCSRSFFFMIFPTWRSFHHLQVIFLQRK